MNESKYTVEIQNDFILVRFFPGMTVEDLSQSSKEIPALVEANHVKKLILDVEMTYEEEGSMFRIESLNLAQGFLAFDKVALVAPDPHQLQYLIQVTEVLKNMGAIKDPDNFKQFADLTDAITWIGAA